MNTIPVAVVTGAGRGIGREIALSLAGDGYAVVIADIDFGAARSVAGEVASQGAQSLALEVQVGDPEAADHMAQTVITRFGRLDALVNNAGFQFASPSVDFPVEKWESVLRVNLSGAFFCARAAARQMLQQHSGVIINIASVAGIIGIPGRAAYAASKAGLIGLTKSLAAEWAASGIRVNAVAPGYIETELVYRGVQEGYLNLDQLRSRIPIGTLGRPSDVAELTSFLISPAAANITGQVMITDGGLTSVL